MCAPLSGIEGEAGQAAVRPGRLAARQGGKTAGVEEAQRGGGRGAAEKDGGRGKTQEGRRGAAGEAAERGRGAGEAADRGRGAGEAAERGGGTGETEKRGRRAGATEERGRGSQVEDLGSRLVHCCSHFSLRIKNLCQHVLLYCLCMRAYVHWCACVFIRPHVVDHEGWLA